MVTLLYYSIIILFAGERIFEIGTQLAKLQAKWCIAYMPCLPYTVLLKGADVQISPDNLRTMDENCC